MMKSIKKYYRRELVVFGWPLVWWSIICFLLGFLLPPSSSGKRMIKAGHRNEGLI